MASTQKKTTKGKKAPPKPEPPAYNGMARLIGGIVCLLLALCVLVSYFNVDALLLTFIAKALKGTLGCGYYLAAPALLGVAVIQLRHQGRPVILRTTCTLLVPLLAGVLWHLIFCRTAYELGGGLLPLLWKDGQTLGCGGVVAGGLALGSEALVSKVVSIIIFVVLLLAALLGALHMTPQQAVDKMREYRDSRWDDENGEDDLPDDDFEPLPRRRTSSAPEKPVKEKPVRKRAGIDIPLDGEPSAMESGAKKEFFARKSDTVRTPDQVLEQKAAPEPAPTVQEAAPDALAAQKRAIAAKVLSHIQDGDTLFLNSGSTTLRVAEALCARKRLCVVTNSICAAEVLAGYPETHVVLLGGEINAIYGFTFGDDAVQQLGRYQPAWAILSVDGVNAVQGITTYHAEEAMVNRIMLQQAHRVIVAADRRKVGRAGFTGICRLDDRFTVITDSGAKPEELDEIRATGAAVEVAEEA